MKEQTIKNIIDTYLEKIISQELNSRPGLIEPEMSDPEQDKEEEWQTWLPIDSRVTDDEIAELENRFGHQFPADYITFLKHKHFYELFISEASFCQHPVNLWRAKQTEIIFESYPREFLIDKGYMPFAVWSDWGMLCFDTNRDNGDNNYPIVLWDHEWPDKTEYRYQGFYDALLKIDQEDRNNS